MATQLSKWRFRITEVSWYCLGGLSSRDCNINKICARCRNPQLLHSHRFLARLRSSGPLILYLETGSTTPPPLGIIGGYSASPKVVMADTLRSDPFVFISIYPTRAWDLCEGMDEGIEWASTLWSGCWKRKICDDLVDGSVDRIHTYVAWQIRPSWKSDLFHGALVYCLHRFILVIASLLS